MTKSARILRRAACLPLAALLAAPLLLGVHTARAAQPAQTDGSVTDLSAYSSPEVLVLYQDGGMEVLTYGSMDALASALDTLSKDSSVALVQPNYAYTSAALDTSDPLLEEQWALDNDGSFAMAEQSNPYPVYDDPFAQPTPPWQWHWPRLGQGQLCRRQQRSDGPGGHRHQPGNGLGGLRRGQPGRNRGPGGHGHRLQPHRSVRPDLGQ